MPERYRIRGAELFSVGNHRGKDYTRQDLEDICRNFKLISTGKRPQHIPPGKIGHKEQQQKLGEDGHPVEQMDESDKPAAGWVSKCWHDGHFLYGDVEDIAPEEAKAIKSKRYRKTSAEVYDEDQATKAGIKGHKGKVLRAVSFLGSEPPQVKGLADLPEPERYSERPFRTVDVVSRQGYWEVFSEGGTMPLEGESDTPGMGDRQEMIALLAKHGYNTGVLEEAPDAVLAECLRICESKDKRQEEGDMGGEEETTTTTTEKPVGGEEESAEYGEDAEMMKMFEKYFERPEDENDQEGMQKYGERVKRFMEKFGEHCKMGEPGGTEVSALTSQGKKDKGAEMMSERRIEQIVNDRVSKALAKVGNGTIAKLQKFAEETEAERLKSLVDTTMERLGNRIPPRERQAEREILEMLADDVKVYKFSEGGKTFNRTKFQQRVKTLEARSPVGTERVKSNNAKDPQTGLTEADAEVEKITQAFHHFSEEFPKSTTAEGLVAGFRAEQKFNPRLTAAEFLDGLVPSAY
jgi:hypothetical protein